MLLLIALILVVFWLLGGLANIGGGLVNILLVLALIALIYHLYEGRNL